MPDRRVVIERDAKGRVTRSIDPFRAQQIPDVAGRFTQARSQHRRQADLMWAGTMAAMFTDHELGLLRDLGFLSPHDMGLLSEVGRALDRKAAS